MILRALKVKSWRCYTGSVSLPNVTETINVIHAPNGLGKSTLFEAVTRSLFDSHRVGGEAIEHIRPWGRELTPAVEMEFAHDGTEYRLEKRFLDDKKAELSRKEDGKWARLAEGDAATERLREMLHSEAPGRGPSDNRHWGIGQVLWAAQGKLPFIEPTESVIEAIQQSLDVQTAGREMGEVEQRIEAAYSEAFKSDGTYRSGRAAPEVVKLKDNLQGLEEQRGALVEEVNVFEEASRQVEDFRSRRTAASVTEKELRSSLEKARANAKAYDQNRSRAETCAANENAAANKHRTLQDRINDIADARKKHDQTQVALDKQTEELKTLQANKQDADKRLAKAKQDLAAAQQQQQAVEKARQTATRAREFVDAHRRTEELLKTIGQVEELQKEHQRLQSEIAGLTAPEKETLKDIRQTITQRDKTQTKLDAALIHLEITPEADGELDVVVGENSSRVPLQSDETVTIKGSPEVIVDVSGLGRIRAFGPTGSVDKLRQALADSESALQTLCDPFGTQDVDALQSLRDKLDSKQGDLEKLNSKLDTLLDEQTYEELQREKTQADNTCSAILAEYEKWAEESPDPDALKQEADDLANSVQQALTTAQSERDRAESAVEEAASQLHEHEICIAESKQSLKQYNEQLKQLQDDGLDDKARQEQLNEIALRWDAEKAKRESAEQALAQFGQDPSAEVEALERQLEGVRAQATKAVEDEQSALGRLQQIADNGSYSRLAQLDNQIEQLRERITQEERRLEAIRLLHTLLTERRTEISSTVVRPVAKKASRILERIAGTRLGPIALGEGFTPAGVTPTLADEQATMDDLSGGEEEQVHLAVRLALADELSQAERQMVVLDDVLVATDAGRLARIHTILDELAQRLQIIVLTCHPERYRGLASANFIDLQGCIDSH